MQVLAPGRPAEGQSHRVINVYIDGYNFYYSISKADHTFLKLGWCNFRLLSERLVKKAFPEARVGAVKYFTAPVSRHEIHPGEARRQRLWLDALMLGTKGQVRVIEGYHDQHEHKPRIEKQTDIKLAISMIRDATMRPEDPRHRRFRGTDPYSACNGVLLVSSDNDLLPAADMVRNYGVDVAVFHQVGDDRKHPYLIEEEDLKESLLPDEISQGDGPAITWSEYLKLKIDSEAASAELDRDCFDQCQVEATKSDDRETKVGCVVLHRERGIVARGYNAIPFGVAHVPSERLSRPQKYAWIEHAERNAIYAAARSGTSLRRCTLYVDLMPCGDCARGIVQSGIKEVVVSAEGMQAYSNASFREQHMVAKVLFEEAGIHLRFA